MNLELAWQYELEVKLIKVERKDEEAISTISTLTCHGKTILLFVVV